MKYLSLEEKLNNGYKIYHTDGGQIFPRAGWYIQKTDKDGYVKDIIYLDEFIKQAVDNSLDKSE